MSKHKIISFVKSGIRLIGCGLGMSYFWHHWLPLHAFAFLFLAEILGILEEKFETPVGESFAAFNARTMCTAEALKQGVWSGNVSEQNPWQTGRYTE